MTRFLVVMLVAAGCWLGPAVTASAHVFFERAAPRVGAVVTAPPERVSVWFDGRIEPLFSTIAVYNEAKRQVDQSDGRVDADDPTRLRVTVPVLPPGTYTVIWSVVALDGHPTDGRFTFTIQGEATP